MANLESAKKRQRQNETRRTRNRARKQRVKSEVRKFTDAMKQGEFSVAQEQYRAVSKILDQTASKGTLHKNMAARRKSRLAKQLNRAMAAAAK